MAESIRLSLSATRDLVTEPMPALSRVYELKLCLSKSLLWQLAANAAGPSVEPQNQFLHRHRLNAFACLSSRNECSD